MAESQTPTNRLARRGLMFILSSPSGAGKTTISRMLLDADDEIKLSVSVTTRPPRAGDVVRVFILPPTIAELERRLRGRGTDSDEVIAARMERARAEISHWDAYDYVVINEDVDSCFAKVREILDAERTKRQRQTGLIPFVRELMA
jgi:guanylate kinase